MRDGYLNYNEFRNQFFDKFGNRKNNYIIEKYCKSSNGWIKVYPSFSASL